MSNLRSGLIRIAYENPSLRPHLLPLLTKQAAYDDELPVEFPRGGDPLNNYQSHTLMENDKVRVWMVGSTSAHSNDNSLGVQELLPSKPGKRRLRVWLYRNQMHVLGYGNHFRMQNLLRDARLSRSMDFDGVTRAMYAALEKAKERAIEESRTTRTWPLTEDDFSRVLFPSGAIDAREISHLKVEPANYKPVPFRGKDFSGTSEYNEFQFYADEDEDEDMAQVEGGMYKQTFYKETSAKAARKLFQLLQADPDFCKGMTSEQFKKYLVDNKIGYDVATVWRPLKKV